MSMQAQVLEALRNLIDARGGNAPVTVGPMPPENGISILPAAGRVTQTTLAGGETVTLEVALNARNASQAAALEALCALHEALARLDELPAGAGWQMTAIRSSALPAYVEQEEGQWLYGSALMVEYSTQG